jgi:dolichyl-phosphate-mannose--protein O-mannosyl transferase
MNGFNRFIMLLVAILLIVIPVFLLLVAFGVIASSAVSSIVNYDAVVQGLSGVSTSSITQGARIIIAVIGAIVVLIALYLLLKELTFGKTLARQSTTHPDGRRH